MKDFIYKLYSYDNFTLYLTIILVILVILFVLVLIFGKRDQKLEETKMLRLAELEKNGLKQDAFKEENKEPEKVEVKAPTAPSASIEELPMESQDAPVLTQSEEAKAQDTQEEISVQTVGKKAIVEPETVTVTIFDPALKDASELLGEPEDLVEKNDEKEPEQVAPIRTRDREEEQSPINIDELMNFNFDDIDNSLEKDLTELENIKNAFNEIKVPEINTSEINTPEEKNSEINTSEVNTQEVEEPEVKVEEVKKAEKLIEEKESVKKEEEQPKVFKPSQVFSSVFVNKEVPKDEDDEPLIKFSDEETDLEDEVIIPDLAPIVEDEDDFDLPTLKSADKEESVEMPTSIKINEETSSKDDEGMFSFDELMKENK